MTGQQQRWMLHFCPLSPYCRKWGAPWRLAIRVPGWYVSVAVRPRDRFAGKIDLDAWKKRGEVVSISGPHWVSISRTDRVLYG